MKSVITVVGKDKPGIIAKVATVLAENKVNILDINQTIMHGNFTMLMMVDLSLSDKTVATLADILAECGKELEVNIHVQHEGIFNAMHEI